MEAKGKMEILKKADVVDAGGLGFLIILESYLEALKGKPEEKKDTPIDGKEKMPSVKTKRFIQVLANRYEIVSLIKNLKFKEEKVKEQLKNFGDSLDIVRIKDKMKIHIHTDYPDKVKKL